MKRPTAWSIGQCATLACVLEVTAAKPGNVHRAADFDDAGLNDFLASAVAIGPAMERAVDGSIGQTVLESLRATRGVTAANTNLGMLLLLAPLAAVPRDTPLSEGVRAVLRDLSPQDAIDVYQAIRDTNPGGLVPRDATVTRQDVAQRAPDCLRGAMSQAAPWDLVARQYSNDFEEVLNRALPWLLEIEPERPLSERIVHVHLRLMSEYPDSLIARKCGQDVAAQSAARAAAVLRAGSIGSEEYWRAVSDLDFWLRSDGHRRNPGTSADLIAAALFAGLRDRRITPPFG